MTVEIGRQEAAGLAIDACRAVGASDATTNSLVNATMSAALLGSPALGFPHFVDYLESFRAGRINRDPAPILKRPFAAYLVCDADKGIAQLGFDLAFDAIVETAQQVGIALFTQANSYTTGELGYYTRRLAQRGLVSIAATNAEPLMAASAGRPVIYSTNPLAFGFPLGENVSPLVIDQSSSATAYVNIVEAARDGRKIPQGWAVDKNGIETTDAVEALAGALLPFGGRKGANLALMVEMLSAGLSGGAWSMDASPFKSGGESPSVGLTLVAMMPGSSDAGHVERAAVQVRRLQELGIYVPGVSAADKRGQGAERVNMPRAIYEKIRDIAG